MWGRLKLSGTQLVRTGTAAVEGEIRHSRRESSGNYGQSAGSPARNPQPGALGELSVASNASVELLADGAAVLTEQLANLSDRREVVRIQGAAGDTQRLSGQIDAAGAGPPSAGTTPDAATPA